MQILSIDPGINNAGFSVIDISDSLIVKETVLVKNARKFTDEEKVTELKFGNRAVKVLNIINKINELISRYCIETIVIEAPFYNALTPVAYGSLLEVISVIKYDIAIKNNIDFKIIEPLMVKKLFSNNHMASKQVIKEFLIKKVDSKDIILSDSVNIDLLSEHEIDSIAIGFVYVLILAEEKNVNNYIIN